MSLSRRALPASPNRRGWCPGLTRPMPTGDGLLARVHPPLGFLTLPQARAVAEGARRFGNGHLDLTARANLQVRGVSEGTRIPLARLLEAAGLGDVRHDGGPNRLTLTRPLAGLDPAETIDVPALARAIEAAGLAVAGLPAKTLVVVEGRPGAAMPEADVYVFALGAGSVGLAVAGGDDLHDPVACTVGDAPTAVAALLEAFARTGRRRAYDLSEQERRVLAAIVATYAAALPPHSAGESTLRSSGGEEGATAVAYPAAGLTHLSPTLVALAVDAPFGRCTADALDSMTEAAEALGAREIRLSSARGLVLVVGDAPRAASVLADLARDFIVAADDPRRGVAACTGAPACASGTTPTLADAARLAKTFAPLAARGFSAHVSGCAKGCARPGSADLTLVGRDGLYGAVVGGNPGDTPMLRLPIEAALERLGRAGTIGLAAAFAPDHAVTGCGRDGRPA